MLPFLVGRAGRHDNLLGDGVACCVAGYVFVSGQGAQLGPRYYYRALPYLLPLAAIGGSHPALHDTLALPLAYGDRGSGPHATADRRTSISTG